MLNTVDLNTLENNKKNISCQAIHTYESSPDGFEDKLVEEVGHVHVIVHLEHLLLVKHLHLVQGAVTTATGNVSSLHAEVL